MLTALSAESRAKIPVAIIEDQHRTREGLEMLINATEEFACVGAFASIEEALATACRPAPAVALVDLGLPGMSGIEGIPALRRLYPETAFVVLTIYEENERVFEALCAGAIGYLLKNTPPARLIDALREAVAGGAPMSPEIARKVVDLFRRFRPPAQAQYDLTPHERRLLKLLVEGHSYKSAGAELGVTVNTIAFHVRSIYGKLQVHSKSEAVARALRENLIG